MRDKLEKYYLSMVEGERRGVVASIWKALFWVVSWLYLIVIQFRYLLYRIRIIPRRTVTAWVISVGNITLGGTGKTPVVEEIARLLYSRGRKVAVVSRGYRRKTGPLLKRLREKLGGAPTTRVVSNGSNIILNARTAGDEPYMLASNLEGIPVLVNRNRVKGALYAVRRLKADTIILDDGFQHLRLRRDLDIVLIDSGRPFGNHRLVPRGILREPVRNLSRADLFLITKVREGDQGPLREELSRLNPRAEILECRYQPLFLRDLRTSLRSTLDYLKGAKVASLAGIARPEEFEKLLARLGAELIHSRRFADHYFYHPQELIDILNQAREKGAEVLVTTEKDAVRLPRLPQGGLPAFALRVRIVGTGPKADFDQGILSFLRQREKKR